MRRLQIDGQFECQWRLYREVIWLGTFEDLVGISCGLSKNDDGIDSIRQQSPARWKEAIGIDRRHAILFRKFDNQRAVDLHENVRQHEQCNVRQSSEFLDRALDAIGVSDRRGDTAHIEFRRSGVKCAKEVLIEWRRVGIIDQGDLSGVRRYLDD